VGGLNISAENLDPASNDIECDSDSFLRGGQNVLEGSKISSKSGPGGPNIYISLQDSDQDKCHIFNDFFTSIFTEEDCTSIPQYQLNSCNSMLTEITITPAIVLDKLKQLNPTKSPGPEGWPLFCLKTLSPPNFLGYLKKSIPIWKT